MSVDAWGRCVRFNGLTKSVFRSAAAARRHAKTSRVKLYVYECPRCGGWHVSKRARRAR